MTTPYRQKPRKKVAELDAEVEELREEMAGVREELAALRETMAADERPGVAGVVRDAAVSGLGHALGSGNPILLLVAVVVLVFSTFAAFGVRVHIDHHIDHHQEWREVIDDE